MNFSSWIILFISVILSTALAQEKSLASISPNDLKEVMNERTTTANAYDGFTVRRNSVIYPSPGLNTMRDFLSHKMAQIVGLAGGSEKKHLLNITTFETNVFDRNGQTKKVTGKNFVVVLSQNDNRTSEDEPIVLLANYDTDFKDGTNPVEDNGSGVAALLVIGHQIARELEAEKYTLKNSIILAAVDVSSRKYDSHSSGPPTLESNTGSEHFAQHFLPHYLRDRKGFQGVIVLDSLMNYADSASQSTEGMDGTYESAKQEIAKANFAGNFVALVARGGSVDEGLIESFEQGWEQARKQKRSEHGGNYPAEPNLIKFIHTKDAGSGSAFYHFYKSDQGSFYSHTNYRTGPAYPAILLTDTRELRNSTCSIPGRCTTPAHFYDEAIKPQNLQFLHRVTLAVYETTVKLQSGGLKSSEVSLLLCVAALVGVLSKHFL